MSIFVMDHDVTAISDGYVNVYNEQARQTLKFRVGGGLGRAQALIHTSPARGYRHVTGSWLVQERVKNIPVCTLEFACRKTGTIQRLQAVGVLKLS
jgi:hypothetical protein